MKIFSILFLMSISLLFFAGCVEKEEMKLENISCKGAAGDINYSMKAFFVGCGEKEGFSIKKLLKAIKEAPQLNPRKGDGYINCLIEEEDACILFVVLDEDSLLMIRRCDTIVVYSVEEKKIRNNYFFQGKKRKAEEFFSREYDFWITYWIDASPPINTTY